jgi:hypothetical protein
VRVGSCQPSWKGGKGAGLEEPDEDEDEEEEDEMEPEMDVVVGGEVRSVEKPDLPMEKHLIDQILCTALSSSCSAAVGGRLHSMCATCVDSRRRKGSAGRHPGPC